MTDITQLLDTAITDAHASAARENRYGFFNIAGNRVRVHNSLRTGETNFYLNDQKLSRQQIERRFRGVLA